MFAIGDGEWPGISKLVEEAGEVVQVCGKLMGTRGVAQHWDGSDLRDRLQEELADLQAAITFVMVQCDLDLAAISKRTGVKLETFLAWHHDLPAPSHAEGGES